MAIEDAYVLSREIARSCHDLMRALVAYEMERVPRTMQVSFPKIISARSDDAIRTRLV